MVHEWHSISVSAFATNACKFLNLVLPPEPKIEYEVNGNGDTAFWGIEEYYEEAYSGIINNWTGYILNQKPVTVHYFEKLLRQMVIDNLVWRNTKASIVDEYKMTDVKHKIMLLEFTPLERAIYDDLTWFAPKQDSAHKKDNKKRNKIQEKTQLEEFCGNLNEDWGNNLTEIKQFFLNKKEKDISLLEDEIKNLNAVVAKAELELGGSKVWRKQLSKPLRKLDKITKKLEKCRRIQKRIADAPPVNMSDNDDCLEAYIERYGTKLGNLVAYLKNIFGQNPSTGVIIFSQWSTYLRRIAKLLAEQEISSTYVEGNVFSKTNAMQKFKDKEVEVKVILMNIEKTASGANLIEASHVIFMEPLCNNREYIRATETQAIGRAQRQGQTEVVTVSRFLVNGTNDHSKYMKWYGKSNTTVS
jgi:SNF2 family DNA or RNA helicase